MIEFDIALSIILQDVKTTGQERVSLHHALHRVLAEDVRSDVDMPPFHKAAMDGYACRRKDLHLEMQIMEVLAAGDVPKKSIGRGQCSKIMTGAMVPAGADTVIMVEQTVQRGEETVRFTGEKTNPNIAEKGEDVKTGDMICAAGTHILPQQIAMLAAAGCDTPLVYTKPRVGILSTGDELVEPDTTPGKGKIRNTNGPQLTCQAIASHTEARYLGIIPDSEEATDKAIAEALANNDVVILSGGVSMGDFDFVPKVMKNNGVEILFNKVAVKPGRPTVFGKTKDAAIFGLPGNPVSSFINFETLVKPLLFQMMGATYRPLSVGMPLAVPFKRKKADRLEFLPVTIDQHGRVHPASYHGSAHIQAISKSDGLMSVAKGIYALKEGDLVNVRPI